MPLKYFLSIYLFAYLVAAFFWRTYMVWKRTGVNPVVFKGSDDVHDFIGRMFKLVFVLLIAVVLVYSFFPKLYSYAVPLLWLEHSWLRGLGIIFLALSLVWTVLAQTQMGESWRIGIDQKHRTNLVTGGVFTLSRNPIFLGMMITLLGLFLVIPNALTLLTLVLGVVLIQIQVRIEEEFLVKTHGDQYAQYRIHVPRWL